MASVYVVAVGDRGAPLGYLLHKSQRRLEDFADHTVRELEMAALRRGVLMEITRGKMVRMTEKALRNEIQGFDDYVAPCLDAKGLSIAVQRGGVWNFGCEMFPSARRERTYPHRLPPPSQIGSRGWRENPRIETHSNICECGHDRSSHTPIIERDAQGARIVGYGTCLALWCDKCKGYKPTEHPDWHRRGYYSENPSGSRVRRDKNESWNKRQIEQLKSTRHWVFRGAVGTPHGVSFASAPSAAAAIKKMNRYYPGKSFPEPEEISYEQMRAMLKSSGEWDLD